MKNVFLTLVLVFFGISLKSQSKDQNTFINYIQILVCDSTSVFYYPKLLDKVKEHPNELTDVDIKYLYYGQVFKIGYVPRPLFGNERNEFDKYVSNNRKNKIIEYGTDLLNKYPLDLTTLMYTNKCLKDKKLPDTTYYFEKRYRMLLNCIMTSGDGKSFETAFKVTSIWDEYIIKGILGYFGGEDAIVPSNHDFSCYCVWNTPKGKIYFEEIYSIDEKK